MTRYLLDKMNEQERTAFEESYFADKAVFDQLVAAESDLVDDRVNGRLDKETSKRFDLIYMADPVKRERVEFARALAEKITQEAKGVWAFAESRPTVTLSSRLAALFGGRPLVTFAGAFAALLMLIGAVWFFGKNGAEKQNGSAKIQPRDIPVSVNGTPTTPVPANDTPQPPLSNVRPEANQTSPKPVPTPPAAAPLRTVTLALNIGGLRGNSSGSTPTIEVPVGTREVSLSLRIAENVYPAYRYSITTAGGATVVGQTNIRAHTSGSGAAFKISVPANALSSGDYILTLSGAAEDGSTDNIGKSLFRIKKP